MSETIYLSVLDVEALHVFIMEKTGDPPAVLRNRPLLESAVARPQMAAFYANAGLVELCALLIVGISQAQTFVDGNKRTALIAADTFLRVNGYRFSGQPLEIASWIEAVAGRSGSVEEATTSFAQWLRGNVIPY